MRSTLHHQLPLLAVLCFAPLIANAQTKDSPKDTPKPAASAQPSAPVGASPERTTASFGDWILRCDSVAPPAKRVCEVAQIVTLQGQASPVAQIALGKLVANEPMRLTVVLPTNIAIQSKPQLLTAKAGSPSIDLFWQSCTNVGCFASAEIKDDVLTAFNAQTEPGRVLFKDAAGREVALPLSFRGFAQAVAALGKEKDM